MKPSLSLQSICLVSLSITIAGAVDSSRAQPSQEADSDSAAVGTIVDQYHQALVSGDSAGAASLLAPAAIVLEGGGMETRAEYLSHHLSADIAFAQAVTRERGFTTVTVRGDVAWVASTSRVKGSFRDREIDSRGAELMVLTRMPDGWRITAIHWSSRANR